jgi:hypothetical protein
LTSEERREAIKELARRLPDLLREAVDQGYVIKQALEAVQDAEFPEQDLERIHGEMEKLCNQLEDTASIARGVTVMMSEMANGNGQDSGN